jgi:hypothetical protein
LAEARQEALAAVNQWAYPPEKLGMVPEVLERALDELELCLERLNARYEGHLVRGDEKEPTQLRQEVDRRIAGLMSRCGAGAPRARLNFLLKRYDALQRDWEHRARRRAPSTSPKPLFAARIVERRSPTPPLGTIAPLVEAPRTADDVRRPFAESSRKTPDLRPLTLRDATPTVTDLRTPEERGLFSLGSTVTLERVRELHARLQMAAPVGVRGVSVERLAHKLRETEAKLLAEHGDRRISFDVIVRNGRAVVKPIVH